ncbi:MAG: hypothetical protein JSS57_25430 [Proteobacteria bacterium]|nr:hypothetical protein [Pseudomonadota bacterium]
MDNNKNGAPSTPLSATGHNNSATGVYLVVDPQGQQHSISVEYDDKRGMWRFRGLGFDFWAYPMMGEPDLPDLITEGFQAEVNGAGDDSGFEATLSINCPPSGSLTNDLFASKCLKELGRFWCLLKEIEDAE